MNLKTRENPNRASTKSFRRKRAAFHLARRIISHWQFKRLQPELVRPVRAACELLQFIWHWLILTVIKVQDNLESRAERVEILIMRSMEYNSD